MIVVDASLIVHVCIETRTSDQLKKTLMLSDLALVAPDVIELEFLQVMRRYARRHDLPAERLDDAFMTFDDLRITHYSHGTLRDRIWSLRENLTAYDAAYFALAEQLGAPLWTRDRKFADIPGHAVEVRIL